MSRAQLSLKRLYAIAPVAGANVLISRMCSSVLLKTKLVCVQCAWVSQASTVLFMSVTAAASALAIFIALNDWSPAAYAISFICGGLLFSIYALSAAHMNDHLQREDIILEATEGLLLVCGAGAAMGSAFIGLFLDVFKPGTFLFFFACMLALLGCYTMYLIRRRTDLPPEMQEPFVSMTRTPREALKFYPRMDTQPQLSEALASHDSADPEL